MLVNQTFLRKLSYLSQTHSHFPPHSVNSKIKALIQQGQHTQALQLYSKNRTHITNYTYPSLLKACASLSRLQHGKILHASIMVSRFNSDPYVVTSLVSMYVKCGSLVDAVHVFDELFERDIGVCDVTVWNSMIDGYLRFGQFGDGLVLFRRMQALSVRPDGYSLCILLSECDGRFGYLERKQIHGYAVRNMCNDDSYLESALIVGYFNCGRTTDAWRLFEEVGDKGNVVSWNVMIGGFCENGLWEKSLEFYWLAKSENVGIVSATLTCTLTACCQGESVNFGEQIHTDVIKMGFENDSYVCTSLLTMYSKCKLVDEAEEVFFQVLGKTVELWNAMISAFFGNGCVYSALNLYKQMRLCKILPDSFTLSNILSSTTMVGLYNFGRLIHTDLVKRPVDCSVAVNSALLKMYSKFGITDDLNLIFGSMEKRDVVAWGSMIAGYCQNRKYKEALNIYREMEANGLKPDSDILTTVINACSGLENFHLGYVIHGLVIKHGLQVDVFVGSSLVDMYSKCSFPEMAENVFSDMPLKNLVAWNSIISCYCRNGLPELSIRMFPQIMQHGLFPDSVSITSVLAAISSMAGLLKGKAVHGYLMRLRISLDHQVENTLIDMYFKCGHLKYAEYIFQRMPQKSLVTWNSIIGGYGSHGDCLRALRLFDEMRSSGITPDGVTFLSLLSCCNHSGFIEQGLNLFEIMRVEYGIDPRMEHYTNIVDLLGRAGRLEDAFTFIESMPVKADKSIWLSLLSSCRAHHNVDIGEMAADNLLKIEPSRGSNYVQLLNIYGEAEQWDKTAELRASMREKRLKKNPGCSWIELSSKVVVFYSGDLSSPRSIGVYEALTSLTRNSAKKIFHVEGVEAFHE